MIKDAFDSLLRDKTRTLFYWLTFLLTTAFIYLFYNMMLSDPVYMDVNIDGRVPDVQGAALALFYPDPLKNPLNNAHNVLTIVTVMVIVLCGINVIFSNDFYVKTKTKEVAVRMICGATFMQVTWYLLAQTFMILFCALPLGIALAFGCIPLMNKILPMVCESSFPIITTMDGFVHPTAIVFYLIFIATLLNASFTSKSAAALMLNKNTNLGVNKDPVIYAEGIGSKLKTVFYLFVYLAPIGIFYYNRLSIPVFVSVGMYGFVKCVDKVFVPFLTMIADRCFNRPKQLIATGFIRQDLRMIRWNIVLYMICPVILMSFFVQNQTGTITEVIIFICFAFMSCLQAFAMVFKVGAVLSDHESDYVLLHRFGFEKKERKVIRRMEVVGLYLLIGIVIMLYAGNIFAAYCMSGMLTVDVLLLLLGVLMIPLMIACIINMLLFVHD